MPDHGMSTLPLPRLRYISQATKPMRLPARMKRPRLPQLTRREASAKCRSVTKEINRAKISLGGSAAGSNGSRTRPTHRSVVAAF